MRREDLKGVFIVLLQQKIKNDPEARVLFSFSKGESLNEDRKIEIFKIFDECASKAKAESEITFEAINMVFGEELAKEYLLYSQTELKKA